MLSENTGAACAPEELVDCCFSWQSGAVHAVLSLLAEPEDDYSGDDGI